MKLQDSFNKMIKELSGETTNYLNDEFEETHANIQKITQTLKLLFEGKRTNIRCERVGLEGGIADTLKKLRKEKGFTQEQLAKAVGLSKNAIIQYENGNRKPNFESLSKLENFFKVNFQYLLGRTDKNSFDEINDSSKELFETTLIELANAYFQQQIITEEQGYYKGMRDGLKLTSKFEIMGMPVQVKLLVKRQTTESEVRHETSGTN